jgi:hypothetical protein
MKRGITIAIGANIRVHIIPKVKTRLPGKLNLAILKAARVETNNVNSVLIKDIIKLFGKIIFSIRSPSYRPVMENSSFQFSRVGLKIILGGYANVSTPGLKDVKTIQTGGKIEIKITKKRTI